MVAIIQSQTFKDLYNKINQNKDIVSKNKEILTQNINSAKNAVTEYQKQLSQLTTKAYQSVRQGIANREQYMSSVESRFNKKSYDSAVNQTKLAIQKEIQNVNKIYNDSKQEYQKTLMDMHDVTLSEAEIKKFESQGYKPYIENGKLLFRKYETVVQPEVAVPDVSETKTITITPKYIPPYVYDKLSKSMMGKDLVNKGLIYTTIPSRTQSQQPSIITKTVAVPTTIYNLLSKSIAGKKLVDTGVLQKDITSQLKEFNKMSGIDQDAIIKSMYNTDKTTQIYRAYTGNIGVISHNKLPYQGERLVEFYKTHGLNLNTRNEKEVRAAIRWMLYEDAIDSVGAQERILSKLGPIDRTLSTAGKSVVGMTSGIANFPEFIFEEGVGRVYHGITSGGKDLNKPFTTGMIQKTFGFSPRAYYEKEISPVFAGPSGAMGIGMSAATREYEMRTGAWTPEKERQYQSQLKIVQKYPESFIGGTFGELLGTKMGTTVFHGAKAAGNKGFQFVTQKTIGKPILPSAFGPTNIIRTVKYGVKRAKGKIEFEKPEIQLSKSVTPENIYGQIPYREAIQKFKETKGVIEPERFSLSHTSPSPLSIWRKTKRVGKGSSESPGIATSPYGEAVPQFFQLEPTFEPPSFRFSLFPKLKLPTITNITTRDILHYPKGFKSFEKSAELMKTQPKGDYGLISSKMELGRWGKVEPEVTIPYKSRLMFTSTPKYTRYKGVTIPLPRAKTFDLPIRPPWLVGKVFKGMTRSYEDYLTSSEGIIKEFKSTSKAEAKSIFKASSPYERSITGKITQSIKNYNKALKDIDTIAKRQQLKIDEWTKPTVRGQLKLKGFESIERVSEFGEKQILEKSFEPKYSQYSFLKGFKPSYKQKEYTSKYKPTYTPKYTPYNSKYKIYSNKYRPYIPPSKPKYEERVSEGSYKSYQSYKPYESKEKPYRPYYSSGKSKNTRLIIIPPGRSVVGDKKKRQRKWFVSTTGGYRQRKFNVGSLVIQPLSKPISILPKNMKRSV